jgi:hypothetical protein
MDLLGYSDTSLEICLKDKPRREVQDILRQVYLHPTKLRICPCVRQTADLWLWTSLEFLHPTYSNELTHPK